MVTVAVLGGGQLGRMLGLAGIPLGVEFRFLDPTPDAPAAAVGHLVTGALGDEAALAETARGADVVTYEWEGVPADAARFLADRVPVRPGARSLEVSQDRLVEKETFRSVGIPTAEFAGVDIARGAGARDRARSGFPAVLKTRRGGYDGKGQRVLRTADDVERGLVRARRRAAHPRRIRPVRPRAVDRRGAIDRRRRRVLAASSRTSTTTASSA